MFTLTNASIETKLILKWAAIIIAILIVLFLLFRLLVFVKDIIFPTPPPKPTTSFGKLTFLPFPQNVTERKLTYSVNTISGELPAIKSIAKINIINKPKPDLQALKIIGDRISFGGFKNKPIKITDTIYDWTNTEGLLKKRMRINIINYNFNVTSSPSSDPDVLKGTNLPDAKGATALAEGFLDNMGYLSEDIDLSKTKTTLYSIQNDGFTKASSLSNASAIKVNFIQKDIDKIPVVYKNSDDSNINVIVVGGQFSPQVLQANYFYQGLSDTSSTYPIKSTQDAFDQLKNGDAYIASYLGTTNEVSINNVFLAYYFSDSDQEYTMPVVVFEGSEGFLAYVSAVKDEWVNK